jgi:ERCC4-type nuclease
MDRPRIIIDSREQEGFAFDPLKVDVERRALPAGDYSLAGFEQRVAVERKSLQDFVSTVIRGRKRFTVELERLRSYERACIVLEGSLADIFGRRYRGGADPASVYGALLWVLVDLGIPVIPCGDRQVACRLTQDFLLRFHRMATEAPHAEP